MTAVCICVWGNILDQLREVASRSDKMAPKATPECDLHNRNAMAGNRPVAQGDSSQEKVQLKRELGLFSAVSLIVGVMIGSGIFVSPTMALQEAGSVGFCLIIWATCGVISLLGALCFAELGLLVPRSGAEYVYLQEAFGSLHKFWGPLPSFLCSWVYVAVLRPAEVAVIIMAFAQYVCQPLEMYIGDFEEDSKETAKKYIAILALGLLTYVNLVSVKLFVRVQNVFTVSKLMACLVVVISGIYVLCTGYTENIRRGFQGSNLSPQNVALAFYYALWPFDGWSAVTTVTEEVKKPEVNILRSILIAVPMVTAVYFMMNVAYMTVLSIPEMTSSPAVAVTLADRTLGPVNFVIPLGVALSTFGCALSIQFSVTRLCYVAAREGHMLQALSYIHTRRLTPAPAVLLQGLLTLVFIVAGDIASLIDFASFLIWIFYGLAMVALLVMRRTKQDAVRPYKVPLVFPLFIILVSLFLCLVPIITTPSPRYFIALVLIGLGVAVYVPLVFYRLRPRWMDKFSFIIQVLVEVVPAEEHAAD